MCIHAVFSPEGLASRCGMPYLLSGTPSSPERFQPSHKVFLHICDLRTRGLRPASSVKHAASLPHQTRTHVVIMIENKIYRYCGLLWLFQLTPMHYIRLSYVTQTCSVHMNMVGKTCSTLPYRGFLYCKLEAGLSGKIVTKLEAKMC